MVVMAATGLGAATQTVGPAVMAVAGDTATVPPTVFQDVIHAVPGIVAIAAATAVTTTDITGTVEDGASRDGDAVGKPRRTSPSETGRIGCSSISQIG